MDKLVLADLLQKGKSTWIIAKETGQSQTNVRYYIKKYNLRATGGTSKDTANGLLCSNCNSPLKGRQVKYCDKCLSQVERIKNKIYNSYPQQKARAIGRKKDLVLRRGGQCERCGYNKNLSALSFHHLDSDLKTMSLDQRHLGNNRKDVIEKEFQNVILLCSNCHFEIHNPQLDNWNQ